ncbi:hypothetical protein ACWCSD_11625, partial [Nonomuraea sp. NPDC001684]
EASDRAVATFCSTSRIEVPAALIALIVAAIARAGSVATTQEGLTQVALNRGGMLFCKPSADHHRRPDIAFVPVDGLPPSILGLAWLRAGRTASILAFNELAMEVVRRHETVAA